MILIDELKYQPYPFDNENDLELSIKKISTDLFGHEPIYIDTKKKIGEKGKIKNIPDGYLLDLSSPKEPKLFVIENELSKHEPLKHIAVQILEFSLSFETAQIQVKNILKESLLSDNTAINKCNKYIHKNNFDNIDVLLERAIYGENKFNALVIIDECEEELEKVLTNKFQFPIEILVIQRFQSDNKEIAYIFEPFLSDISTIPIELDSNQSKQIDPAEIDTIVVPAREDGFNEVFINENRWYAIRIHSTMISKLKYIAAYRVAPDSAITHIAQIKNIEKWKDSNKYVVNFAESAKVINPINLVPKSLVKAPQAPRYTKYDKLISAKTLDEVF